MTTPPGLPERALQAVLRRSKARQVAKERSTLPPHVYVVWQGTTVQTECDDNHD